MNNYRIKNKDRLDKWLWDHRHSGLRSVKGPPPTGATYFDGELIKRPMNVAWVDIVTGERFDMEYEVEE